MNNSNQAQKGFQTFVLTLSISLILFSIIYYFVTNSGMEKPDIVRDMSKDVTVEEKEVSDASMEEVSVFKKLADQDIKVTKRAVLAGAAEELGSESEETTESTVPDTGVTGVTAGLLISIVIFVASLSYIIVNPREIALGKFERQFLKD